MSTVTASMLWGNVESHAHEAVVLVVLVEVVGTLLAGIERDGGPMTGGFVLLSLHGLDLVHLLALVAHCVFDKA